MSSNIESQIRAAASSRFDRNTTEELLEFAGYLKVSLEGTENQDQLRKRLLSHLGLVDPTGAALRKSQTKAVSKGEIRPGYNLTPNGKWGGRRHLIRLSPPPGSKLAKAEPVGWNGKATFWIPYNETVSVPEPIFNVLMDRRSRTPIQVKIKQPDGTEEMTTAWEFNSIPFVIYGVDPKTEGLAGSMTEWYSDHKPSWFKERNTRELQSICTLLEISTKLKNGAIEQSKSDEQMLADIFLFLFSNADVEDADAKAA